MSSGPGPPPPTEADLARLPGGAYPALQAFLRTNAGLRPEWKHYGAKTGWTLKLFQGKRNLCFLTPRAGMLLIGFALSARVTEQALASELPDAMKQEIRDARVYVEGRGPCGLR